MPYGIGSETTGCTPAPSGLFGLPLGEERAARQLARCYKALVETRSGVRPSWTHPTRQALDATGAWLEQMGGGDFRGGLTVTGPCGGGKTTLIQAVAMLLEGHAAHFAAWHETDAFGRPLQRPLSRRVVYKSARDLYNDPRFNPDDSEWVYNSAYAECRDAGLCVLDDVGQEVTAFKRWGNEYKLVARVILERYDLGRPLVLSSNLSVAQLGDKYGEFVGDRIHEMCRFVRIEQSSFRRATEEEEEP